MGTDVSTPFEFQYFGGFQKDDYFQGMGDGARGMMQLWILGGGGGAIAKLDYFRSYF